MLPFIAAAASEPTSTQLTLQIVYVIMGTIQTVALAYIGAKWAKSQSNGGIRVNTALERGDSGAASNVASAVTTATE